MNEQKHERGNIIKYEVKCIKREDEQIGVLTVRGNWPTGSESRTDDEILAKNILEIVKDGTISKVVLDLSELRYKSGNSFLNFIFSAIRSNSKFEYVIIARGETETGIRSLMEFSGMKFCCNGIYHDLNIGIEKV